MKNYIFWFHNEICATTVSEKSPFHLNISQTIMNQKMFTRCVCPNFKGSESHHTLTWKPARRLVCDNHTTLISCTKTHPDHKAVSVAYIWRTCLRVPHAHPEQRKEVKAIAFRFSMWLLDRTETSPKSCPNAKCS